MNESVFLNYYRDELSQLKTRASKFSEKYPEITKHLSCQHHIADDPHINRLIESFAFLTSQIKLQFDEQDNELIESLLYLLYPHVLSSIPAMTIAQIDNQHLINPIQLPPNSILTTSGQQGDYKFTSPQAIQLWPIRISECRFVTHNAYSTLSITLQSKQPFKQLAQQGLDQLSFYLNLETEYLSQIQALFYNALRQIKIEAFEHSAALNTSQFKAGGYSENEQLLRYSANTEEAFRLLIEYFSLPEKFNFFSVARLSNDLLQLNDNEVTLTFNFTHACTPLSSAITTDKIKLHCFPMINYFECLSEPFRLDHKEFEYSLCIHQTRNESQAEIEQIKEVWLDFGDFQQQAIPVYRQCEHEQSSLLYYAKKKSYLTSQTNIKNDYTDVITFSNRSVNLNAEPIVSAKLLCSNQDTSELTHLTDIHFQLEDKKSNFIKEIKAIIAPTSKRRWIKELADYEKYLSLFSLRFDFISQNDDVLTDNFKKILLSFSAIHSDIHRFLLPGIKRLSYQMQLNRSSYSLDRIIVYTLEIDRSYFHQVNLFIFGRITHEFLKLCSPINITTHLLLTDEKQEVLFKFGR